jgi:hypothetical protein
MIDHLIQSFDLTASPNAALIDKASCQRCNETFGVADRTPVGEQQAMTECTGQRRFKIGYRGGIEYFCLEAQGRAKRQMGTFLIHACGGLEQLDDRFFAQQCLLGTALQQQRIISVDMMSKAINITA